jgi:galactose oxidase
MYDAVNGKILTVSPPHLTQKLSLTPHQVGGSPDYQDSYATTNAHLITIGTPGTTPTVQTLTSMHYARAFANGVVLPNGKVFITGGQTYAVPFTDTNSILTPELWDPVAQTFTVLPPHLVPRNYHSIVSSLFHVMRYGWRWDG